MTRRTAIRPKAAITMLVAAALVAAGLTVLGPVTPAGAATTASATPTCTMTAGGGLATTNAAGTRNGTVDVLDSLAQVLPTTRFAGASSAALCSARNAYSSFQVEVSATAGVGLSNIAMSASSLTGPGGGTIPGTAAGVNSDIQFDQEQYVTLSGLSDSELDPANTTNDSVTPAASRVSRNETTGACTGASCRFPDELVPDRDSVYGEARNAFKNLNVLSGENRVAWVDVFVPTATPAGTYTGSVTVTQSTGAPTTVPVQLQVVAATLPATSTMDSAFFYEKASPTDPWGDYAAAAELGLDDRISVVPDGDIGANKSAVLAPLLNGTRPTTIQPPKLQDANGRYATLTDFPISAAWQNFQNYKSLFTAATTTKPWAYCDEAAVTTCSNAYNANAATEWPGIPLLAIDDPSYGWADPETQVVPTTLSAVTGGVVDLQQYLDPTYTNWLAGTGYNNDTSDRSSYLRNWAAGAAGRQVWTYLTSESGSGPYSTSKVNTGFASYGIDQIASEQEATGWTSFNDGINGELYWEVDASLSQAMGTRVGQNAGLTGDGLLFYPYNAAQVGGTHSVPLESIRLKRIRDGQQDNELLKLATTQKLTLSDGRTARSISTTLFPMVSASAVTATALDTAEQDLYRLFPLPAPVVPPATVVNRTDLNCDGTPDFIAVQAGTGKLLYYPRTATDWTPDAPITVGTGFGATTTTLTYTALLEPGDVNGDGSPDLIGRKSDGSMWLLAGHCTGSFAAAVQLPFTTTDPVAPGDFNGDGHADLLDKHADGTLWMLAGTGNGTFAAPTQVGAGWGALQITAAGDVNRDGAVDLIARQSDGSFLLYEGSGTGGWKTVYGGITMGLTLTVANDPQTFGVGDLSGDGNPDLVAIDSTGTMYRYNGDGSTHLNTTATRIGGGWNSVNLVEVAQ